MTTRNPAPAGVSQLKDIVMNLQTRVEALIAAEKRATERITALEKDLSVSQAHIDELQTHCIALQLELDDVADDLLEAQAAGVMRDSSSDSSGNESEPSLFGRYEEVERQVKVAMGNRELKRAVTLCFCRKMDIPKLCASYLPPYSNLNATATAEGASADAADEIPLRFDWYLSATEPVNDKALDELTKFVLLKGATLHALAARPIFIVKGEGIKKLVTERFKALAKTYRDYRLVQDHERRTDELMQQADARMNDAEAGAPVQDEPMAVDGVDDERAKKVKARTERKNALARNQTAQKYASKYRNLLRKHLPDGDDAKKPENDIVFCYQTQSPWVSDDDAANRDGKKSVARKWESEAFQAMKRLEQRNDIKVDDPKDLKQLRKMKKARRVPVPADGSDSDDVPHIQKAQQRVLPWMVDSAFLERHPGAALHIRKVENAVDAQS